MSAVVVRPAFAIEYVAMLFCRELVYVWTEILEAAEVDSDEVIVAHPVPADEEDPEIIPAAWRFGDVRQ